MSVTVAKFLDVAAGLQANQFSIGDRYTVESISELDDTYKQLMDKPIPAITAVIGGDGRPNLTPMWFDYEGDKRGFTPQKDRLDPQGPANHDALVEPREHVPLDEHEGDGRA